MERGERTYRKIERRPYPNMSSRRGLLLLLEESPWSASPKWECDPGITGAKSWLGVPLMIGDRVIGVMTVQSYTTPGSTASGRRSADDRR